MSTPPIAEQVAGHLSGYLGPFNAKVAVKTFSQRSLGVDQESLTVEHVPALLEALRPMLATLVGRASSEALLEQIRREVS